MRTFPHFVRYEWNSDLESKENFFVAEGKVAIDWNREREWKEEPEEYQFIKLKFLM